MDAVMISDAPMPLEELLAVVDGARVELTPAARARIEASRAVVEKALAGTEPVYGLNTGVGHMKDVRVPDEELRRNQELLLLTHAGGLGPRLGPHVVRAAMAVRLNGLARGGSGASPRVAEVLAEMLNAGVQPIVPEAGSVGAGDLGQLASIGLVAIGEGRAEYDGEVLGGAQALQRAGITPLQLEPKDGLALISSNGVSIGDGVLVLARAGHLAELVDVVAALSLEAIRGDPSIASPAVGTAKPFPGQVESCRAILAALDGSDLLGPDPRGSVQDPLSFRVAPQVHGALREAIAFARRAVEIELNGQGDNPLASVEQGALIHNGNFHPIVMAIAFDQLRIAIAHAGQLSERRMGHLWDAFFERMAESGPPPTGWGMPDLLGLPLRYPAAARLAELKQLAAPATLDVPPLDIGIEDHATGAPLSVRKSDAAVALLEDIISVEMLLANDVLSVTDPNVTLGAGTGALLGRVRAAIASSSEDRSPAVVHAAVRDAVFGGANPRRARGRARPRSG
jgi:histidine ammonia-lyase